MSDTTTPSSRWAADGQRDPHGDRYACERAALALGNLTDDELANAVFLHGNEQPTMADMAAGKALAGIVYLTAAKDRIRWLSRRLAAATTPQPAELAEQQVDALRERTPADFAIEHAGYLANASTRLLKACGELDSLVMRRDEHDDVDDSDMHAAQDRVDEASDSVRSAIYEFEKRRDRALAATGKQQVGEAQGDMFWLAVDGERMGSSVEELIDDMCDGEEVEIQTAAQLPNFWVRVKAGDGGSVDFDVIDQRDAAPGVGNGD